MKIRKDERTAHHIQKQMTTYHTQKQITRFYISAIRVVWGLLSLMTLWTGFRVYVKDDFSYINEMSWYIVPTFVLGLITFFLWVLHKREQKKIYQKMLVGWQREKSEAHLAKKGVDCSGM